MAQQIPAPLGRGPKRNLFTHVVASLGLRIIKGELNPALPFPKEADLGAEFGASRSVIREAVKSLAARGLIASQTRTGIRVLEPINWNLLDAEVLNWRYSTMPQAEFYGELFEIRLLIEPEAARLAAIRGSTAEIAIIEKAFAAMSEAARTGTSGVAADLAFHRAILAAAHNALLLQMGNLIAVGLDIAHRLSSESFAVFLPMHQRVLDAIIARDSDAAGNAMRHLLSETREFMSRLIWA
ncbi:FadR/GntR family transcriptional regulator [Aestuariivirga sp. YIM B02566]|uniref:FadR family transcriptional regulator n=1 Tax=Taklimakanibacter albus TaxID=2800327 RepID=A0ACC5R8K7_9HYPH|nr:FCD domain-containing protein [Aestuariivirga sp. YIM B02566]MBK1868950.1 FadR family transcriptional regulator [Aestuariivirga sp. YIM B02566]